MVRMMQENRNMQNCQRSSQGSGRGAVCIDTRRVFDSCKDRDCYEDTRVYLTAEGETALANTTNIKTRSARLIYAYVGIDEVPFNCGFYRVSVRYYIDVEFEGCLGVGRSQTFRGLAALEKEVVLYGGDGSTVTFTSDNNSLCNPVINTGVANAPTAIAEVVEPIVLGTKISDCNCPCDCVCRDYPDIPQVIKDYFGGEFVLNPEGAKIYVSFGIFSVIRIERTTQILVDATDYSVPDKECVVGPGNDSPCQLFRAMPFPSGQFKGEACPPEERIVTPRGNGNCGCK
jgi:hypothetical protein